MFSLSCLFYLSLGREVETQKTRTEGHARAHAHTRALALTPTVGFLLHTMDEEISIEELKANLVNYREQLQHVSAQANVLFLGFRHRLCGMVFVFVYQLGSHRMLFFLFASCIHHLVEGPSHAHGSLTCLDFSVHLSVSLHSHYGLRACLPLLCFFWS